MKILNSILAFLLVFSFVISSTLVFASEVPFEVVKTKVNAEITVPAPQGVKAIVVDGVLYGEDTYMVNGKVIDNRKKGDYDHRIKVPIEGVTYHFDFWNVGQMGGEKGFIFKSNYGDAKLTITYETGQAYRMVGTGEKWGSLERQEKEEVSTPSINTLEYDLTFTGGPYGEFTYIRKDGSHVKIAEIRDGNKIYMETSPEPLYLVHQLADKVEIPIKDSSAFEKWMEILGSTESDCSDPKNPTRDSGIRFNDYNGEVMVRPCNDEEAWYGAELDTVLHIDDHIKTGDDSTCSLGLADMTTFVMKPESEIVLSSPSGKRNIVKIVWGKIKANVKRMLKDGSMDVEMSQAVAGIKGTTFVVEDNGKESTLKVIEGHVKFTSKTTGKSQMVGTGEEITATEDGLGEKKTFDIAKENSEWDEIAKNQNNHKGTNIPHEKNTKNNFWIIGILAFVIAFIGVGYFFRKKSDK